jgi:hypothetical protein
MGAPYNQHAYIFDANLQLKDAGLVAASAAATLGGAAKILDLDNGATSPPSNVSTQVAGFFDAYLVILVNALELDSSDESYIVYLQFSNSATFASGIVANGSLFIGHHSSTSAPTGVDTDSAVGRYIVPFTNEWNGTLYRYMRLYTKVAGTVATGINYSAYVTQDKD